MRRIIVLTVVFFLALALVTELVLPSVIARGVAGGLRSALGPGDFKVQLKAYPSLKMLTGRFDQITIESTNVQSAGLVIDQLTATISQVQVNLRDFLAKKITVNRGSSVDVKLTISEKNLKQYVMADVKGVKDPRLVIEPGKVVAGGYLTFGGKDYFVVSEGRFVVKDGGKIGLELFKLAIDDQELPAGLISKVMQLIGGPDLFIDMYKFPIPLEAKEVQMNQGNLVIVARGIGR
ncbi:MAG TPA: DUF2993 domain-containing protein [Bacillota bacterium]|jgi:hypothetical protein